MTGERLRIQDLRVDAGGYATTHPKGPMRPLAVLRQIMLNTLTPAQNPSVTRLVSMRPTNFQTVNKLGAWVPISVLPLTAVVCRNLMPPSVFMCTLAFALYFSLKWLTWWKARSHIVHPAWRSAAYLLAWPGMDADAFLDTRLHARLPAASTWLWATLETIFGAALLWIVARSIPLGQPLLRGWVGMVGLIFVLHFGTFQIIALLWESLGIKA